MSKLVGQLLRNIFIFFVVRRVSVAEHGIKCIAEPHCIAASRALPSAPMRTLEGSSQNAMALIGHKTTALVVVRAFESTTTYLLVSTTTWL